MYPKHCVRKFTSYLSVFLLCLFGAQSALAQTPPEDPSCKSADIIGPKLITEFCWDCLFPITIGGIEFKKGGRKPPPDAVDGKFMCACSDDLGVPRPGLVNSMWEPARLIEFHTTPGCSPTLNGIRFPMNKLNLGALPDVGDELEPAYHHYHYYAFPLLAMLDLYVNRTCSADGYLDLDLMYLSELDPTWKRDDLAYFGNPESSVVANPMATAACAADAVAVSTANYPLEQLFWCAGTWGSIYPLSGNVNTYATLNQVNGLYSARVLAQLHRRGLAYRTLGEDTMCQGKIWPTLVKQQYKFTMLHPFSETKSAHNFGESDLEWGLGKGPVPATGEHQIYTIWRWNDCCVTDGGG